MRDEVKRCSVTDVGSLGNPKLSVARSRTAYSTPSVSRYTHRVDGDGGVMFWEQASLTITAEDGCTAWMVCHITVWRYDLLLASSTAWDADYCNCVSVAWCVCNSVCLSATRLHPAKTAARVETPRLYNVFSAFVSTMFGEWRWI